MNKRLVSVGIAKQTAKGTAVTPPAYSFGLLSGSPFGLDIAQAAEALTGGASRVSQDINRTGVRPGFTFATRAYPRSLGLLLYAALGAKAVSGTTPNYVHSFTPAVTLPWLTCYGKYGSEYTQVTDCRVQSLKISFARGALTVEAQIMGLTALLGQTLWTGTTDEQGAARLLSFGGTYSLDAADASPSSVAVTSGEITIENGLIPLELSSIVQPTDLMEGEQKITVALTIAPDDFAEYKKAVTGTGTGTSPSGVPQLGSFSTLFSIDANTSLTLSATNWPGISAFPDADPAGGHAELALVGQLAGTDFVASLANSIASY